MKIAFRRPSQSTAVVRTMGYPACISLGWSIGTATGCAGCLRVGTYKRTGGFMLLTHTYRYIYIGCRWSSNDFPEVASFDSGSAKKKGWDESYYDEVSLCGNFLDDIAYISLGWRISMNVGCAGCRRVERTASCEEHTTPWSFVDLQPPVQQQQCVCSSHKTVLSPYPDVQHTQRPCRFFLLEALGNSW